MTDENREGEAPAEPSSPPREGEAPAEPFSLSSPQREAPAEPSSSPREGEAPAEPSSPLIRNATAPAKPPSLPSPQGDAPDAALPTRRHPTHGIKYVDGQPTILFDTLCTKDRKPCLANDDFHAVFRQVAANATAWLMGRYVIMPDHIHFFAGDVGGNIPYENWMTYLKSQLTKTYRAALGGRGTPGGRGSRRAAAPQVDSTAPQERRPPDLTAEFRWLTDHWDTRLRSADAYEEKWQYVLLNPVRTGLVARPEDWPYQGEIFELRWN